MTEPQETTDETVETIQSRTDRMLETLDDEQMLRFVVFHEYADAQYDGRIMVENMNMVVNWIKDKTVPVDPDAHKKSKLKVVTKSGET